MFGLIFRRVASLASVSGVTLLLSTVSLPLVDAPGT
jgi:hypothetical protein